MSSLFGWTNGGGSDANKDIKSINNIYYHTCQYLHTYGNVYIYILLNEQAFQCTSIEQALVGFKTPNICSNAATDAFPHLMHRHQEVFQKFEK